MKKLFGVVAVSSMVLSLILTGCAQDKATSSKEAMQTAKSMETVDQKADYLIKQAKAFYNSKEFQQAVDITQYILRYVDKDSQEAKNLLEKAKEALVAKAKEAAGGAVEDVKKKLPGFGQ